MQLESITSCVPVSSPVFTRSLDDDAHKALRKQVEPKGAIRIVVDPDEERVASTFFGAGCPDSEHKPRLAIVP